MNWYVRRHDGSVLYSKATRNRSTKEVEELARNHLSQGAIYGMYDYVGLSTDIMVHFETFINDLDRRGIAVELFLSPYNPVYYEAIETNEYYKNFLEVELYLKALAGNQNLSLMGSYDPRVYGCEQRDVFDEHHTRESCLEKIFDSHDLNSNTNN